MNREEAIYFANCLKNNYTVDLNDMEAFCDMAIKALEQEPTTKNDSKFCPDRKAKTTHMETILHCVEDKCAAYKDGKCLKYNSDQESTTKNNLGLDCVSRQAINGYIDYILSHGMGKKKSFGFIKKFVTKLPSVTPQEPRWIPLTKRPMTDEEREYYREWSDVEGAMIFNCPLPEDGQEVLVSYGGYVCTDTFCKDDGCYFEGVDIDDVDAWMPLPVPFEPQESEDKE